MYTFEFLVGTSWYRLDGVYSSIESALSRLRGVAWVCKDPEGGIVAYGNP